MQDTHAGSTAGCQLIQAKLFVSADGIKNDVQRGCFRRFYIAIHQKALAVGSNVIAGNVAGGNGCPGMGLEELCGCPVERLFSLSTVDGHQISLRIKEEYLLTIAPPAWIGTASGRHL